MGAINDLTQYGLQMVGTVTLENGRFAIKISNLLAQNFERCIYAYVVGDEILRFGSSKKKLGGRIRAWQSDVSKAFAGDYSRTPQREADIWRDMLIKHQLGYLYAREGTRVVTPVGEFNLYQYEERALIDRHQPRCCNDLKPMRAP